MANLSSSLACLVAASTLAFAASAAAQPGTGTGNIGFGGGGCQEVSRAIVNNWFSVKDFMTGGTAKGMKRPRSNDFVCIHPGYTQNAMPRTVPGVGRELSCFELQNGQPVCCDAGMTSCAGL